jgi:hypothetical protein
MDHWIRDCPKCIRDPALVRVQAKAPPDDGPEGCYWRGAMDHWIRDCPKCIDGIRCDVRVQAKAPPDDGPEGIFKVVGRWLAEQIPDPEPPPVPVRVKAPPDGVPFFKSPPASPPSGGTVRQSLPGPPPVKAAPAWLRHSTPGVSVFPPPGQHWRGQPEPAPEGQRLRRSLPRPRRRHPNTAAARCAARDVPNTAAARMNLRRESRSTGTGVFLMRRTICPECGRLGNALMRPRRAD